MQYQFVLFLINFQPRTGKQLLMFLTLTRTLGTMNKTLGLGFINIGDDVT